MICWAIVVAAGTGQRFGSAKQYAQLAGKPMITWALESARQHCGGVVLVLPHEDVIDGAARWPADAVVAGGATRSQSVRAGLEAVPAAAEVIAVHDAARPLASSLIWKSVLDAVAAGADGAIPAVPVSDTVKQVDADGRLTTLDRSTLVAVQTPQAFRAALLRRAHAGGYEATDDAALLEASGARVVAVAGSATNLKVTQPSDLAVAEALLSEIWR